MKRSIVAGAVGSLLALGCGSNSANGTTTPPAEASMKCSELCSRARGCNDQYAGTSCEQDCAGTSPVLLETTSTAVNACLEQPACVDYRECIGNVLKACASVDLSPWFTPMGSRAAQCGLSAADFEAMKEEYAPMSCLGAKGRDAVVACANQAPCSDGAAWRAGVEECLVIAVPMFEDLYKGF